MSKLYQYLGVIKNYFKEKINSNNNFIRRKCMNEIKVKLTYNCLEGYDENDF